MARPSGYGAGAGMIDLLTGASRKTGYQQGFDSEIKNQDAISAMLLKQTQGEQLRQLMDDRKKGLQGFENEAGNGDRVARLILNAIRVSGDKVNPDNIAGGRGKFKNQEILSQANSLLDNGFVDEASAKAQLGGVKGGIQLYNDGRLGTYNKTSGKQQDPSLFNSTVGAVNDLGSARKALASKRDTESSNSQLKTLVEAIKAMAQTGNINAKTATVAPESEAKVGNINSKTSLNEAKTSTENANIQKVFSEISGQNAKNDKVAEETLGVKAKTATINPESEAKISKFKAEVGKLDAETARISGGKKADPATQGQVYTAKLALFKKYSEENVMIKPGVSFKSAPPRDQAEFVNSGFEMIMNNHFPEPQEPALAQPQPQPQPQAEGTGIMSKIMGLFGGNDVPAQQGQAIQQSIQQAPTAALPPQADEFVRSINDDQLNQLFMEMSATGHADLEMIKAQMKARGML